MPISICEASAAHPLVLSPLCRALCCARDLVAVVRMPKLSVTAAVQIGAENVGANYAIALVELASEADDLEKVHQDMDALASILSENAEVILSYQIPHQPWMG